MAKILKIYTGEKAVYSTNGSGTLDINMQKNETRSPSLSSCIKLNSHWNKDPNVRPVLQTCQSGTIQKTFHNTGMGLLTRTLVAQEINANFNMDTPLYFFNSFRLSGSLFRLHQSCVPTLSQSPVGFQTCFFKAHTQSSLSPNKA